MLKKKIMLLFALFFLVTLSSFALAITIQDQLHLNFQITNASGSPQTGTFDFQFNITTLANCSNVLYSNYTSLTTNSNGIISYYLENINLNFSEQYYLCQYRSGILRSNFSFAYAPYCFRARNITWSGLEEIPSNITAFTSYNQSQAANISIFSLYDGRWSLTFNASYNSLNSTYNQFWYNHTSAANASIFSDYDARWSSTFNSSYSSIDYANNSNVYTAQNNYTGNNRHTGLNTFTGNNNFTGNNTFLGNNYFRSTQFFNATNNNRPAIKVYGYSDGGTLTYQYLELYSVNSGKFVAGIGDDGSGGNYGLVQMQGNSSLGGGRIGELDFTDRDRSGADKRAVTLSADCTSRGNCGITELILNANSFIYGVVILPDGRVGYGNINTANQISHLLTVNGNASIDTFLQVGQNVSAGRFINSSFMNATQWVESNNVTVTNTLSPTRIGSTQFVGNITMNDSINIILGTTVGTRIGTATTQLLGFYNVTPIVQPSGNLLTAISNLGLVASPNLTVGGYVLQASSHTSSPVDATTYYFGSEWTIGNNLIADTSRIYIPKAGRVTDIYLSFRTAGTVGSSETSPVSFMLNNVTATNITLLSVQDSAFTNFANTTLSIPVVAGDYFEFKWVTPTWVTNPISVRMRAVIYVQETIS